MNPETRKKIYEVVNTVLNTPRYEIDKMIADIMVTVPTDAKTATRLFIDILINE